MSDTKPATLSRSVLFGGLILLALGLITGGIIGASITRNAEEFEAKLLALGGDLEMVRGENASLRNALDDLKTETGQLRSRFEETAKENQTLRDSLAGLQKEVAPLKGGLDSAKQQNADLAALVEKERGRIDGNVQQIEILAAGAQEAKVERTALSRKDVEIEQRLAGEGKKLVQLGDSVGSLLKTDEELRQRIETGLQQIGACGARLEQESRRLSEVAVAVEGVKKDVADGDSQRLASDKERQAIRTDLDGFSQDLDAARATMGKLIQAIAAMGT